MRKSVLSARPPAPFFAVAFALLLLIPVVLPAATRADFDRVADFSVTLKTLAAAAEGKAPLPTGKMILLSGTVSNVTIINKDEANFKVRIEVITGEWIGLEEVLSYSCYVEYTGAEFFKVFPARAPAKANPDIIAQNSRVLLAGRAVDILTTPLGEKRVLVEGVYIRTIE